MGERIYNVLFLCTGNSARSIMAEAIMNTSGRNRFKAFSAGSHPTGHMHPLALETLRDMHLPSDGLRSKSWDEFAAPGGPPLDFVFTVCDKAAGEACPFWPGQPITAHWGVEDPAAFEGPVERKRNLFRNVATVLRRRIDLFLCLPLESLDRMSLQQKLTEIGQ
ncbi:MAG TPA: arsenate reductase ArsC, partial [Candidatus Acidoferrum sp.]|nr:arsenate reductase ArsC [Candidatus Acidoferrum sp.]